MNAILPIDQTKAATPAITTRPQDWETLNSPGHVLGARLKFLGNIGLPVALAAFAGAIYLGVNLTAGAVPSGFPVPREIVASLMGDPMTATDLGTIRVPYNFHWMTAHAPTTRGLDPAQWTALVSAVKADAQQFGDSAAEWATVAELEIAPRITRPAKVFDADANLPSGTVAVGEGGYVAGMAFIPVVAAVDGQWAIAVTDFNGRCGTIAGPAVEDCQALPFEDMAELIRALRPIPVQQAQE